MTQLSVIVITFILSGTLVFIRNIFHAIYIWQIKEYRVDRVWSHLRYKEDPSGRNLIINVLQYLFLTLNLLFFLNPKNYLLIIPALIFASYIYESWTFIDDVITKKFIRPKKSIRNLLIFFFSLSTLFAFNFLPINFLHNLQTNKTALLTNDVVSFEDFLVQKDVTTNMDTIPIVVLILVISSTLILVSDLIVPAVVSFWVLITEPLAQIKRYRIIKKAKEKIKKHKGFKVVAITGSYGKSTTKELLFTILENNFKVAKTDANFNSHVGIAQEIIKNLKDDTEIFIAEMGAYNKKDIVKSTKILKPDISIVTGITAQHLSLFKTIKRLVEAKYEIVKALKKDGLAIFNGNNEYCLSMASKTSKRICLYFVNFNELEDINDRVVNINNKKIYTESDKGCRGLVFAFNIKKIKGQIGFTFKLRYDQEVYDLKVNIVGKRNIENLLAAISASLELGMNIKDIVAKINTTKFPQVHLKWFDGLNNSRILDDSYNSNPVGFKMALDEIKDEKARKKILVTKGIIELGNKKQEIYKSLARKIVKTMDLLITTDKNLAKSVFKLDKNFDIIYTKNSREFIKILEQKVNEDDIVLLEGAMPASVRMFLIDSN